MKLGMMADVPSAVMKPHSDRRRGDEGRDLDRHACGSTWSGTSDSRNSVQEKMKQSTAVAAMPPRTIGSTTRRNVWKRVAPSIIAASSTSRGTSSKNDFSKQHGERQVDQRVDQDQPGVGVAQPEIAEHEDNRNDDGDRRHEALRQHPEEIGLLAAEGHAREAVGGKRRQDQRQRGRADRHDGVSTQRLARIVGAGAAFGRRRPRRPAACRCRRATRRAR